MVGSVKHLRKIAYGKSEISITVIHENKLDKFDKPYITYSPRPSWLRQEQKIIQCKSLSHVITAVIIILKHSS